MEQKICKNKKCKRVLAEGYKHKYCENCRNKQAEQAKKILTASLGVVVAVGGTVLSRATHGLIGVNKK